MARFQPYNKNNPLKAFVAKPVDPVEECKSNSTYEFEEWSDEDKKCFTLLPLLNLGICTPDTCTDYDVKKIIQFLYNSAETLSDKKLVCDVEVKCSNSRPENQLLNDRGSIAVLCFVLVIIAIMIFGSCYDIYVVHPIREANQKQDELFDTAPPIQEPQGWFVKFIMLFSIFSNIDYIMDTKTEGGQIRCLHGARFLSMCWIIFGHTYYYICTSLTTDNLFHALREFPKIFYNQLVVQAPLAVDSFFFFSGLLTSYIFFKKLNSGHVKLLSWQTWFAYYVRRYLRLTPVYLVIMILHVTLFTYVSDGPFWKPIDATFCRNSWWTNLLYVNNFVMQDDPCMGWTWYMANDFQLHCFAPILIILIYKLKLWGVVIGFLFLLGSAMINLYITVIHDYPPAPILSSSLDIVKVLNEYWVDLYVKPYVRCGPYIVGSLVGYFLYTTKRKFELPLVQLIGGWLISTILGIYSVFGLYHYTKTGEISTFWHILYTICGRPAYALALGWVTFACETGNAGKINSILGHKMFIPLSKLTFCAYLIHPLLLQFRPNAFHFTHSFQLLYMFFVAVFMSYLSALCLSLAFEAPVMNFDKMIFGETKQHKQRNQANENLQHHVINGIDEKLLNEAGKK
uniref:Acyltransferase 3 domain-containing protein n=1 Tax=Acrobeloides nanus TaxID=290746 RepID=A0A914C2C8_9BILA